MASAEYLVAHVSNIVGRQNDSSAVASVLIGVNHENDSNDR